MGRRCYYCGKELAGILARYDHYHVEKCPNPPKSFGDWILKNIKGSLTDFALWCLWVAHGLVFLIFQLPSVVKWFLKRQRTTKVLGVGYIGIWSVVIAGSALELAAVTYLILFAPWTILIMVAMAYKVYSTNWKGKADQGE